MKILKTITVALAALTMTVSAQQERIPIPSVLIMPDGEFANVFLLGSDKNNLYYVDNMRAVNTLAKRRSDVASIYMMEPVEFKEAMDLYESRKYTEALEKFRAVKVRYKKFEFLAGNHYTRAGFYELECLRKLMKLDELSATLKDYHSDNLMRANQKQQLEIYSFWEAVRTKSWRRLNDLAESWKKRQVPVTQRSQIAYTHGLALEGLKKPNEALNAYATAMTADFSKSEIIVRNAALNSLRIFAAMADVKTAISLWESVDEDKDSEGYGWLLEANALARLYNKTGMGAGVALPQEYAMFLKYTPKDVLKEEKEIEASKEEDSEATK